MPAQVISYIDTPGPDLSDRDLEINFGGRLTTAEAVQTGQGRGLVAPNPGAAALTPMKVMASPPTITLGAQSASPTITDPIIYQETSSVFRYFGATPTTISTWYQPNPRTTYWAVDFETDAAAIEISSQSAASAAKYRLIVNGELVTVDPQDGQTGSGGNYYMHVDFGSNQPRHIVLEMTTFFYFGGVYVSESETIWRSSTPVGPRVAILGDSYTEGATQTGIQSWGVEMGRLFGWRDVQASGRGGTGYLKTSVPQVKFRDRVQADILDPRVGADGVSRAPDIIVVAGGINDAGVFTASEIGAEADLLFADIRAEAPDAILIVLSQFRPTGNPDQSTLDLRDALAVSGAEADLFIDTIVATTTGLNTLGWITGNGKSTSTTGNGNADRYIGSDGVHPTVAGYQYIGRRAAQAIAAAMPILGDS